MVGSVRRHGRFLVTSGLAALLSIAVLGAPAAATPTSWRFTRTPTIAHRSVGMTSVSCATARSCLSLTYDGDMGALQWDGRRWSATAPPRFSADLSCATATMCAAVGGLGNRPSVDTWDGTTWTPNTIKGPGGFSALSGVSCVSATWCMAVGDSTGPALAERFDGSKWEIVDTPTSVRGQALWDVSCTSETSCVAVGVNVGCRSCNTATVRAETWDGEQWTVTRNVANPGPKTSVLTRVSCGGPDRCLAIGHRSDEDTYYPLVEQFNGRRWTVVPTPLPPGGLASDVDDVSCGHSVGCVAVGWWVGPSGRSQMLATWDGTAWSYPSLEVHPQGELKAVDCSDARHCVAVGLDRDAGSSFDRPLALVGKTPPS
jgi:hypothetical protein